MTTPAGPDSTPGRPAATTGPAHDRGRYRVPDPGVFRGGGTGAVFEAVVAHDLVRDPHHPTADPDDPVDPTAGDGAAETAGDGRLRFPAGTRVALKSLFAIDADRFDKVRQRSVLLPAHPHLAAHIECFTGPPPTAPDVGEEDFSFYSTQVWVAGRTFSAACQDADPDEMLTWAAQIASGLDALHQVPGGGLAHRDVYGRNIVVTPAGSAVLIDFDTVLRGDAADTVLAQLQSRSTGPRSRTLAGAQADDRASLALTLLRGFARDTTSSRPLRELPGSAEATLAGIAADPHAAVAVLLDAYENEPPATAAELIDAVRAHFGDPDHPLTDVAADQAPGRRRTLVGAAAALVLLLGTGGAYATTLGHHSHATADTPTAGPASPPSSTRSSAQSSSGTRHASGRPSRSPGHRRRTHHVPGPSASSSVPSTVTVTVPAGPITDPGSTNAAGTSHPGGARPPSSPTPAPTHAPHTSPTPTPTHSPTPSTSPSPSPTAWVGHYETSGSEVHTHANYLNAGGADGPLMDNHATVWITCRVQGFVVADGNPWWYRIGSSPWNGDFYGSADAFYNNGSTSGSLAGTPWFDPAVPLC